MGPNGPYLNRYHNKVDPSSSNPGRMGQEGDVLLMPPAAVEAAQKMLDAGTPSAPTTPGAPGWDPTGQGNQAKPAKPATSGPSPLLLLGGAVVAAKLAGVW